MTYLAPKAGCYNDEANRHSPSVRQAFDSHPIGRHLSLSMSMIRASDEPLLSLPD
jgi:hypothetical protein